MLGSTLLGIPASPLLAQSTVIFASRQMHEHFRGHLAPARPTTAKAVSRSSAAGPAIFATVRPSVTGGAGTGTTRRAIDQTSVFLSAENEYCDVTASFSR